MFKSLILAGCLAFGFWQEGGDKPAVRCNRHEKNPAPCTKCEVGCDSNGNRTHDNRCSNKCHEQFCDCSPPCVTE